MLRKLPQKQHCFSSFNSIAQSSKSREFSSQYANRKKLLKTNPFEVAHPSHTRILQNPIISLSYLSYIKESTLHTIKLLYCTFGCKDNEKRPPCMVFQIPLRILHSSQDPSIVKPHTYPFKLGSLSWLHYALFLGSIFPGLLQMHKL